LVLSSFKLKTLNKRNLQIIFIMIKANL